MERLAIFFMVEPGYLEEQARLLVRSIRRFGGPHANAPVWAIAPRRSERTLEPETLACLSENGAWLVAAPINDGPMRGYPLANKPLAGAWLEEMLEGRVETLLFLDTDTAVFGSLETFCLAAGEKVAVRPAHRARGIAPGADEPVDAYWQEMYDLCGVANPDALPMTTTVDEATVRCHVNSGVVAVDPRAGILRAWSLNLHRIWEAGMARRANLSVPQRRLVEQSCLSATILAKCVPGDVRLLPSAANYFLAYHAQLPPAAKLRSLDDCVVAHYHCMFYNANSVRSLPMGAERRAFADAELPLRARRRPWVRRMKQRLGRWRDKALGSL